MKLVVEDYINHIVGHRFFQLDHRFAEEQHWYRANWIAVEFDMLYRWHGLAPDVIFKDPANPAGAKLGQLEFRNNNALFEEIGIGPLLDAVSKQPAGQAGLGNTPDFLWAAENANIKMARDFRLASFNDYRERFSLPRLRSFAELTRDATAQDKLQRLYGHVDNVEYIVGLFAEQPQPGLLFGDLLNAMVAYDAFTQIFSNPLLSQNVYNEATFTDYGLDLIKQTTSLQVLAERNVSGQFKASLGYVAPPESDPARIPEVGTAASEIAIDAFLGEAKREGEAETSRAIAASIREKTRARTCRGAACLAGRAPESARTRSCHFPC